MRTRAILSLALLSGLVAPGVRAEERAAEARREGEGFMFRAGGPVRVAAGEDYRTVVVAGGDARVDGRVSDALVVIDGSATIAGEVGGDLVVVDGKAVLEEGARVGGDVDLVSSELEQAATATIGGSVSRREGFEVPWVFTSILWVGLSLVVVLAGLAFAALAGPQLGDSAAHLGRAPGATLLTTLLVWLGLPAAAVAGLMTIVGIPLGLAIFLFVIPVLWFVGYLVAGTALGRAVLPRQREAPHPYAAAALGLVALQIIALLPWVGGLILWLAGLLGAGALVLRTWRRSGSRRQRAGVPPLVQAPGLPR